VIRRWLTPAEAADIVGVNRRVLLRWANGGDVPHRHLTSRVVRFAEDELLGWLDSRPGKTLAKVLER
jgi:excisionase family DNA binding protein